MRRAGSATKRRMPSALSHLRSPASEAGSLWLCLLGQCSRSDAQHPSRRAAVGRLGRGDLADLLLAVDSGSLRPPAGERSLPGLEVHSTSASAKRLAAPDGIQLSTPSGRKPKRSRAAAVSPLPPVFPACSCCFQALQRAATSQRTHRSAARRRGKVDLPNLPSACSSDRLRPAAAERRSPPLPVHTTSARPERLAAPDGTQA